ncbi:MAG: SMC-Scp complex subunit ScpB [Acidobacteria bacterium]|nr:SMC-Scp complex subunit ScpB [Acidobacteriota bacterium]
MENVPEKIVPNTALKAAVEAIIYVADEPVTVEQMAAALEGCTLEDVRSALESLLEEYCQPERGLEIRSVAGGYKMFTKPEHHEAIHKLVRQLSPPLKLSLAALETLATIAYRQPITLPEIEQIRGVHGAGVLKTLLEKKLITTAGRKSVVGRPILYKTTKEFLIQFGLNNREELPSIEEFEELARAAFGTDATRMQPESNVRISSASEETPGNPPTESLEAASGDAPVAAEEKSGDD